MISFVSHGAGILTIMEASAEHDCCSEAQRNARRTGTSYFVCTVFLFINLLNHDLREDAYICPSHPKKAPQNLLLHGKLNSGLAAQDSDIAF